MTTITTMPEPVATEVFNAVDCLWTAPGQARRRKTAEKWLDEARNIEDRAASARVVVLVFEAAMARYG